MLVTKSGRPHSCVPRSWLCSQLGAGPTGTCHRTAPALRRVQPVGSAWAMADLWGGWGLIKGKGRFMQSGKAIRGPYSFILFLSLLQN